MPNGDTGSWARTGKVETLKIMVTVLLALAVTALGLYVNRLEKQIDKQDEVNTRQWQFMSEMKNEQTGILRDIEYLKGQ